MFEIQKCGRFIEQKHVWILHQGPSEKHELTLAPRQCRNRTICQVANPETFERLQCEIDITLTFETDQRLVRRPTHQDEFPDPKRKGHMEILWNESNAPREPAPRKR